MIHHRYFLFLLARRTPAFAAIIILLSSLSSVAQISPPGLDGARSVNWNAIGFTHHFSKKINSSFYFGGEYQSDPTTAQIKKPGIFVLNQETYWNFASRWQLAFCASFRKEAVYQTAAPYDFENPGWANETRYYLRLFYRYKRGRWSFAHSFRPEYRGFYTTSWNQWPVVPIQLRFRLKLQTTYDLKSHNNSLVVANEWLEATNYNSSVMQWGQLTFTEDRLSTYFRHAFKKPDMLFDAGVMHQVWFVNGVHYIPYLAFDIIFQNPFGRKS
ncbi:MAG: hypothetical protein OJF59_002040 [Cytophagales bacterium]|jgi:hypothetical protein|nr:hypothetical protein [Bacteroidota bacterium]MBS1980934.1 hypothetical protein [Bacteroidota bacterium]WHZ08287.1 MAG: hypothetical protein OJF59_002040 [Cytophagales bacterium]